MVGEAEATLQDALVLITAEVAQTYLEIRTLKRGPTWLAAI